MVILKVAGVDQSSKIVFGNLTAKLNTLDVMLKNPLPDYAAIVLQDLPLAYWRLNEKTGLSAADATGHAHTGTLSGAVTLLQPGAVADGDLAMVFGAAGLVAFTGINVSQGDFSLEAWVFPTSFAAGGHNQVLSGGVGAPAMDMASNGNLFASEVSVNDAPASGSLVPLSKWTHLVITFVLSTKLLSYYVNGVLVASPTWAGYVQASGTANTRIGSTSSFASQFTGGLDEVAIYGAALSAAQVAKHYQAGLGNVFDAVAMPQVGDPVLLDSYSDLILSRFPVAYWRLNEVAGTAAADSALVAHPGTLTGGVTLGAAGGTTDGDHSMSFDGTGRIQTPDSADTQFLGVAPFSLECWVKPSSIPLNSFERVLSKEHTAPSRNGYLIYVNDTGTGGYVGFERWSAGSSNASGTSTPGSIPVGKWTHLVATYDGSRMTIYINGAQAVTASGQTLAVVANPDAFTIAAIAGGTSMFRGAVDEVVIYGRGLTAGEVLLSYNTGVAVFPWVGTVSKVGSSDPVERTGNVFVTLAATNAVVAGASAAPFNISDHPDRVTTFPCTRLRVERQLNNDQTISIKGSCRVQQPGLLPGMTFLLTSSNQGYAAANFTVQDVSVTWANKNTPQCDVTFGDPIVTMAVWVASAAQSAVLPITETKITDGSVTTPKLAANAVTADKLTATLILASLIQAGTGAAHMEMDGSGLRAYDMNGNLVVNIPDDGSPVTVNANVIAKVLTVLGSAVLGGLTDVALSAVLRLDSQQADPGQAPVVTQGWDSVTNPSIATSTDDPHGLEYDAAGGAGGATKVFWRIGYDNTGGKTYLRETLASNRTVNRSLDLGVAPSRSRVARLGSYVYVLIQITGGFVVRRYLATTLALDATYSSVVFPWSGSGGPTEVDPCICSDGTNIYIVSSGGGAAIKWNKYDATMVQVGSTINTGTTPPGGTLRDAACGNFDFGAFRMAVVHLSLGVITFDSTGAQQTNESFPVQTAGDAGLTYGDALADGARFWSGPIIASLTLTKHSTWTWTTASSTYWAGYTWYDDVGTVHESAISPRASIVMGRRKQIVITSPAIPGAGGADEPDKIRFYMLPNATDPGSGGLKLQATQAGVTLTATTYSAAGAADPVSNNFPSGSPGQIQSQAGAILLKGDGTARVQSGVDLPAGTLAYAEVTADTAAISTETTVLTAAAVTVVAGRRVRITAGFGKMSASVAGDVFELRIKEGATVLGLRSFSRAANNSDGEMAVAYVTPSGGSHTYTATLARVSGTGTMAGNASATNKASIVVEDIGT